MTGPLIVSQRAMAVAAALQGVGLAYRAEALVHPLIEEGALVPLLEEWCGTFPGWYLCYPKHATWQRASAPSWTSSAPPTGVNA